MIIVTHLIATFLVIKVFAVYDSSEILLCLLFGVFIDMDELFTTFVEFKRSKNFSSFKKNYIKFGVKRRTWLQESGGLVISLVVSFFLGKFTPFVANFIHCIMDWSCYYKSQPLAPFYNKLETRGFIKTLSLEEFLIIGFLFLLYFHF